MMITAQFFKQNFQNTAEFKSNTDITELQC